MIMIVTNNKRLQKILADAGIASRRMAENMILAGRVAINGFVITRLGSKANPKTQQISLDGKALNLDQPYDYWMVHKPFGVVSTVNDSRGRLRVIDLLPSNVITRLYPVGRLDLNSEGLVILTNDGELAYRLMHPCFRIPRFYRVWVVGRPSFRVLYNLRNGVQIEDSYTAPALVQLRKGTIFCSELSFVVYEGRKREIRLMCAVVGHPVRRLVRFGQGSLKLGNLPVGAARRLKMSELVALKTDVAITI